MNKGEENIFRSWGKEGKEAIEEGGCLPGKVDRPPRKSAPRSNDPSFRRIEIDIDNSSKGAKEDRESARAGPERRAKSGDESGACARGEGSWPFGGHEKMQNAIYNVWCDRHRALKWLNSSSIRSGGDVSPKEGSAGRRCKERGPTPHRNGEEDEHETLD